MKSSLSAFFLFAALIYPAQAHHALFLVSNGLASEAFVISLDDARRISKARAIITGLERKQVHVGGIIVKSHAAYNPRWSFHLDPRSIVFLRPRLKFATQGPLTLRTTLLKSAVPLCLAVDGAPGHQQ
jgi:hypothetical protein